MREELRGCDTDPPWSSEARQALLMPCFSSTHLQGKTLPGRLARTALALILGAFFTQEALSSPPTLSQEISKTDSAGCLLPPTPITLS